MDGLSSTYTSTLYHYDPRPTCNENNPDCGSPYIFCSPKFRCLSKLRPGGNCKGFEGTQICYNGTCKDGKCVADEIPSVTAGPTVLLETTTTLATVIQASTVTTAQLNTTYIAATATTETLTTTNKTEVTPAVTPIPSNPSTNDIFTTSPIETTTVSSFVVASTSQNDINLTSTTNIISVEQITSTITNFSSTTASFDFGTPAFPSVGTQPPTIPAIPGTVAQTTAAQSTTNERGSNLSVIASTIAYSTSEITQFTNPAITTQKGSEVTESVQPTLPSTPFVSAVGSTDSIAIATSISLIPPTVPLPTESNSSILATTPSIPTVEGTNLQTTVVAPITSDRAVQQTGGIESTTVATVATEVQFITRYPAIPTLETSTAQTPPTAASTTIPIETIAPGFTTKIIASPEIPTSTVVTTASPVVISTQAIIIDGSTAEPSSLRSVWFPFTVQRGQGYYKGSVPNAKVTCSGQNVPPGFTSITAGLQWQTPKFPGYTGATVCQARDPALSYGNLTVVLVEVQDAAGQPCKATCLSTKGTYAACSGRVRLSPNAFYSDLNTFRPDAEEALKATWATNTGLVKRRLPDYLVFQCA